MYNYLHIYHLLMIQSSYIYFGEKEFIIQYGPYFVPQLVPL